MTFASYSEAVASSGNAGAARVPRPFAHLPDFVPALVHVLELAGIAGFALLIWHLPEINRPDYLGQHVFSVAFVMLVYSCLTNWAGLNRVNVLMQPMRHADTLFVALVVAHVVFMAIVGGLDVGGMFEHRWFAYLFTGTVLSVLSARAGVVLVLRMLARRRIIGRNLTVLGTGTHMQRFLAKITQDRPYFTNIVGVFDSGCVDTDRVESGVPVLGGIDALLRAARAGYVDDIVVAMPWSADRKVIDTIEQLKELPVNVYLASDLVGFDLDFRPDLGRLGQLPVFEVVQRPITGWNAALKRVIDFVLALLALVVLSPLLLLVALAIRIDSPGPVFFMQRRLGFNNRPFAIYKFRSMHHNCAPVAQVVQTTRNDPRVTRVGRIIRASSIDELPQLLNVLDGSMSLVGPRPHALSHNEEYGAQIRGYFARHKVRPGITGWAQVNGHRGETEQLDKMVKRVEHDVYYAENWSVLFDIRILTMTVLVVLFQKTAY